jgi:transposase
MVGDKGYSSEKVRRHLRGLGVSAVIPRLKQFRRIATRYEKRPTTWLC